MRRFARLRYRLLPYLWASANESVGAATPIVRPLLLEYPDDPTTHHLDSHYLLGPWLLVAPVFDPQGNVRVDLPRGRWFDFWSGEVVMGPRWLELTMPRDRLPVYIRDDSLLPFGPEQSYVGEKPWQPLDIDVRVSSQASLRLEGEGVDIEAQARRQDDEVSLELVGQATLSLRFISPEATAVEAEGDISELRLNQSDGRLELHLCLNGRARISAR